MQLSRFMMMRRAAAGERWPTELQVRLLPYRGPRPEAERPMLWVTSGHARVLAAAPVRARAS